MGYPISYPKLETFIHKTLKIKRSPTYENESLNTKGKEIYIGFSYFLGKFKSLPTIVTDSVFEEILLNDLYQGEFPYNLKTGMNYQEITLEKNQLDLKESIIDALIPRCIYYDNKHNVMVTIYFDDKNVSMRLPTQEDETTYEIKGKQFDH